MFRQSKNAWRHIERFQYLLEVSSSNHFGERLTSEDLFPKKFPKEFFSFQKRKF